MATLSKSILINAPAEKIFAYVADPLSLMEVWPSMVDAQDIQTLPNGGNKFKWTYKMAGVRLQGISEDIEFLPPRKMVSKTTGGIEGTITWLIEPTPAGTKVTGIDEYIVPLPVIGKLAEAVIVKLNEHEAEVVLANLKTRMEMTEVAKSR